MTSREHEAAARRRAAAAFYRPARVTLLLVAETPPTSLDRYFYFDDVTKHDGLFRYVSKLLLGGTAERAGKCSALQDLQKAGVFLIDIKPDPFDRTPLRSLAVPLAEQCRAIDPERIVLIKTSVYDAAFAVLNRFGLPVVDRRIPFPGSGQQRRFETEFAAALDDSATPRQPSNAADLRDKESRG